jgi:hypothetical protein
MYHARRENGLSRYIDEHTDYYSKVGVKKYAATWTSAVEQLVQVLLRTLYNQDLPRIADRKNCSRN